MHDRFIIDRELELYKYIDGEIDLESIVNHVKAFRKKSGEEIRLFDGYGRVYAARILEITKKSIKVKILSVKVYKKPNFRTVLFLPLLTSNIMDQLVSRVCELDVEEIYPVISDRSLNIKGDREISSKLSRWDKISKSSSILAGKHFSTIVNKPFLLPYSFELAETMDIKLIASAGSKIYLNKYLLDNISGFKTIPEHGFRIGLFVGPEGDFSDRELKLSENHGIVPVKLAGNVMSTYTAAIFIVSSIICFFSQDNVS